MRKFAEQQAAVRVPQAPAQAPNRRITAGAGTTVKELAERLGLRPAELIRALLGQGQFATLRQQLDLETIRWLASHFGAVVTEATEQQGRARRQRFPKPWKPVADPLTLRPAADALADVRPLLARTVDAVGTNATARLLDADRAQVSRWGAGTETVSAEMGRRVVDLHDVLTRILRVFDRQTAALWLVGSEPLLGGARPIDVLAMEGAAPVIRCIDGIAQGAHA